MTLLARTQSLEARAKRQRDYEAREAVAERVRARTKNLEKHLRQLDAACARVGALEGTSHQLSLWPPPPIAALEEYDSKGGPRLSVESTRQPEWESFVLALGTFVKKAEDAVAQDVKRAKQRVLEGFSSEELRGYLDDPSTENQAQELFARFESLRQKTWEALPGPELLKVLQQASTFRESVIRLRETGASEELLRFLSLARKNGAPLGALTDTLRAELEARKLFGRLRLFLK